MSGAVYEALANDADLQTLGVVAVEPDYSAEEISREGLTVILRWGTQRVTRGIRNGPRDLTVWVHDPEEKTTDYTRIGAVLRRVREVLEGLEQVTGADGITVVEAAFTGQGSNTRDPGFNTITRNAGYRVLLHDMV